jgi:leader peptidase (prepilin peptidase) / N-methyltransferase
VNPLVPFEAAAILLGLLFGSFLNVCISRIPQRESISRPRSHCPQCSARIRWYDNIPLLSWLLLRGRCRDCKQAIPPRYPLVELATALWFATVAYRCFAAWTSASLQPTLENHVALILIGLSLATLGFLLIGLMVMDWQTLLLPDAFTLTGIAIALLFTFIRAAFLGPTEDRILLGSHHLQLTSPGGVTDYGNVFMTGAEHLILARVAAICGTALILLLIRWLYKALRHREGMGLGDIKLLAMIAGFLGFWPAILALFCGVLAATAYAAFLLARGKAGAATKLPFGSFLAIGGLIAAQFGNRLIDMYTSFLQ